MEAHPDWESCDFAKVDAQGHRRARVIKGTQKAEGLWRRLKHGNAAISEEARYEDARLNLYCQALVWRVQVCGCPYREVLRIRRALRALPLEQKTLVFKYGLTETGRKPRRICTQLPKVSYCRWNMAEEAPGVEGNESE